MKRCPECGSIFPDKDQFCELDGATLVADYPYSNQNVVGDPRLPLVNPPETGGTGGYRYVREAPLPEGRKLLIIVAVAGVAVAMVIFVVYLGMTREQPSQNSNETPSSQAVTQQQMPPPPVQPSPSPSESPSPEASPSPSVMPSPAVAEAARAALSSSPVSTGAEDKSRPAQVKIRLTNGTTVEADEAWETGEGIWYRRSGVVTLLERDQVQAIEKPSASSPSPSPAQSPAATP